MEVIATGNEIVYGELVDTNSSWIAKQSTEQGAQVRRLTCIGDDLAELVKAIKAGLQEARNLLVITGGLGPSHDDLTVEAIAKASHRKIVYDARALALLEGQCNAFSIRLSDRLKRMTRIIEGSIPLHNAVGLAPGIKLQMGNTIIIALPGIPTEMKSMFNRFVRPLIAGTTHQKAARMKLRIVLPLHHLFPIVREMRNCFPDAYIKTYSRSPTHENKTDGLDVVVLMWGIDWDECQTRLTEIESTLRGLVEEKHGEVIVES